MYVCIYIYSVFNIVYNYGIIYIYIYIHVHKVAEVVAEDLLFVTGISYY